MLCVSLHFCVILQDHTTFCKHDKDLNPWPGKEDIHFSCQYNLLKICLLYDVDTISMNNMASHLLLRRHQGYWNLQTFKFQYFATASVTVAIRQIWSPWILVVLRVHSCCWVKSYLGYWLLLGVAAPLYGPSNPLSLFRLWKFASSSTFSRCFFDIRPNFTAVTEKQVKYNGTLKSWLDTACSF